MSKPDLVAFSDWILSTELPEEHDDYQTYLDFRAVFVDGGATPQQARRTLATLFHWGGMWRPSLTGFGATGSIDPLALAGRAASQDLCKLILTTITKPPATTQEEEV